MLNKVVAAVIVMMSAALSYSDVEVVDRHTKASSAAQTPDFSSELHYQLQLLQQEVMTLRGLLDEQAHQLKQLKQQQIDNYLELDRRLSQTGPGSEPGVGAAPSATGKPAAEDELQSYRSAIDLVLKKQDYDGAQTALNEHIRKFPNGRYAPNSQYWLGEIALLKSDLDQARQWFSRLIAEYPVHSKVADAKFKLGKVYHLQGDLVKAKALLEDVAGSQASAAELAKKYLQDNFAS